MPLGFVFAVCLRTLKEVVTGAVQAKPCSGPVHSRRGTSTIARGRGIILRVLLCGGSSGVFHGRHKFLPYRVLPPLYLRSRRCYICWCRCWNLQWDVKISSLSAWSKIRTSTWRRRHCPKTVSAHLARYCSRWSLFMLGALHGFSVPDAAACALL